ncbi:iron efflux ABC transporter ATP-binding subunit FetA [Pantoea ananatis]|uniref:iron efflux ABC transporter ATP-binding subunit FetA n=1 Tax=Pantoea ananas TaxID=553 RepID=UPI002024A47F|nr:ATP-binding cassette domain-containing protein [Pantoea ananatis]URL13773.1 ATP-binding cassette domain-containing protein [Pantoea ananatis]
MTPFLPLLDVQDVTLSSQGRTRLLPVSLQIHRADSLVLTGPSGSGKSTLLKIMALLLNPTAGQIRFRGQDITALNAEEYRQRVSYCFQTPQLFGNTVYENLALPWQLRQQKPQRDHLVTALESVNLSPEMLNKPVEQLSGGEKQRVALLCHLQFVPDVLLLDEVTSALDEDNKRVVHALINSFITSDQMAVVWVSHDVNEIQHATGLLRLAPSEKENNVESA